MKVNALQLDPKNGSIHLALSALNTFKLKNRNLEPTVEGLLAEVQSILGNAASNIPEEDFEKIAGEMYVPVLYITLIHFVFSSVRAPDADLPNTAAFLGGMVAQEVIKMITKQYVPINGYCVIDLVSSTTGIIV